MLDSAAYFHYFQTCIDGLSVPDTFTYPFCYEPHPLCEAAVQDLQAHLTDQTDWHHPFGIEHTTDGDHGKMFGVLVVKNSADELGYLCGFSGLLAGSLHQPGFVPPVFDRVGYSATFKQKSDYIASLNAQVNQLENSAELAQLHKQKDRLSQQSSEEQGALRQTIIEQRQWRKAERQRLLQTLYSSEEIDKRLYELGQQSVKEKRDQKALKQHWLTQQAQVDAQIETFEQRITQLKEERREHSAEVQRFLFNHYHMLNCHGESRSLIDIFSAYPDSVPPAGSGECAAPKMLQYAFQHNLKPVCMAEFWWGKSLKSSIRQHKKYYPACQAKCYPILNYMLADIPMDNNPLQVNQAEHLNIEVVYQDEAIIVINKPSELLSVPGVHVKDSVLTRLQTEYQDREGVFVLHRLDMSTSGLLVFAFTRRANKNLQKQFITRQIEKRYVAVLEGKVSADSGEIRLPLRADLEDRPRQCVCHIDGKSAKTTWTNISTNAQGESRIYLYPHTGRTHQLRVHCAHHDGLNLAIKGDDLYGKQNQRLHLHAEQLSFEHPYTHEKLCFEVSAPF
ncbi:RluA family pseudouridine synthase [Vibrio palustris]|uniref:Ribosomal large subunit pseudouridine synthase A n=1 Tax=Vibrio palustris TaxID=1918946 RepID=A0A1R4B5X0_9VIBR|nr:RluA family pseudouridine synthase [Vibrio palustris]SJL84315.1 Ribosomal large subunit pseudouridine synthase A [Vibrio palustris]